MGEGTAGEGGRAGERAGRAEGVGRDGVIADVTDLVPIGTVDAVTGVVTVLRADGAVVALASGDPLFRGDLVATGSGSQAGVRLADGTVLSLGSGSQVVLDALTLEPASDGGSMALQMLKGVLLAVSGSIAKLAPDAMVIDTPVASIGIRGTALGLAFDPLNAVLAGALLPELELETGEPMPGAIVVRARAPDGTVTATETIAIPGVGFTLVDGVITTAALTPASSSGLFGPATTSSVEGTGIDQRFIRRDDDRGEVEGVGDDLAARLAAFVIEIGGSDLAVLPDASPIIQRSPAWFAGDDIVVAIPLPAPAEMAPLPMPVRLGADAVVRSNNALFDGYWELVTWDIPLLTNEPERPEPYVGRLSVGQDVPNTINVFDLILPPIEGAPRVILSIDFQSVIKGVSHALPTGALVTVLGDGIVQYHPAGRFTYLGQGQAGVDLFTYQVPDGRGGIVTGLVEVRINGVNDPPVAVDDIIAEPVRADDFRVIPASMLLANDFDPDRDDVITLSGVADRSDAGGTVALRADGSIVYDPRQAFRSLPEGATATDIFTYTIADRFGGTASATVTVVIQGVNNPPEARDDAATAVARSEAVVLIDVLANDRDPDDDDDSDTLRVIAAEAASGATVDFTGGPGAGIVYRPATTAAFDPLGAGETGIDTITYTITDRHGAEATAHVKVTVVGVNDRPVANPVVISTGDDGGPVVIDLLDRAVTSDVDANDILAITGILPPPTDFGLTFDLVGGVFSFDPGQLRFLAKGETEILTFTYTVDDGSGAANATASNTVTLTVKGRNDRPEAKPVIATSHEKAGPLTIDLLDPTVTYDVDRSDVLGISEVVQMSGPVVAFSLADGVFTLDPAQLAWLALGESADLTFTYTVDDGSGAANTTASNLITLIVEGRNDPPVANPVSVTTTDQDAMFGLDLLDPAIVSDPDASDTLTITALAQIAGRPAAFFLDAGTLRLDARQFADLGDGEEAVLTFAYTVDDGSGAANAEATNTITLTIEGRNDPPVAGNDRAVTDAGSAVRIRVLDNDRDPDAGDGFSIVAIAGQEVTTDGIVTLPSGARARLNPDGTITYDPAGALDPIQAGTTKTDTFTYTIADTAGAVGIGNVAVTVGPVGAVLPKGGEILTGFDDVDPATDRFPPGWKGTGLLGAVPPDQQPVRIIARDDPALPPLPAGIDGMGLPLAGSNAVLLSAERFLPNTSLSQPFAIEHQLALQHGPFVGPLKIGPAVGITPHSGSAFWTEVFLLPGDTLSFDWSFVATESPFTATPANDFAVVTLAGTDLEGNRVERIHLLADVNTVVDRLGSANGTLGILTSVLHHDGGAGSFTLGFAVFNTLNATNSPLLILDDVRLAAAVPGYDPEGAAFQTVARPPLPGDDSAVTLETEPVTLTVDGLLANDQPAFQDGPLRIVDVAGLAIPGTGQTVLPSGAVLTIAADSTLTYDPAGAFRSVAAGETATDTFAYTVAGSNAGRAIGTVTITIEGVNDPPVAVDEVITPPVKATAAITLPAALLLANAWDPDNGDVLTLVSVAATGETLGTVTLTEGGAVHYDPSDRFRHLSHGETASDTFIYTIEDSHGAQATATATVTVEGVNTAPVAIDDRFIVDEKSVLVGNVLADNGAGADFDPDPWDTLTVTPFEGLSDVGAAVRLEADGSFSYDPTAVPAFVRLGTGESAEDRFTYQIQDGRGGTASGTVQITVTGVNDPPVAADDHFEAFADAPLVLPVAALLANDSDPDANDTLAFVGVDASGMAGSLTVDGEQLRYEPGAAFAGLSPGEQATDAFTYTITDASGETATATVSITVEGVRFPRLLNDFEIDLIGAAPTGWSTMGFVKAVSGYPGVAEDGASRRKPLDALEGDVMVRLDPGPVPLTLLRNALTIDNPHILIDPGDNSQPAAGAAMWRTIDDLQAGDVISFRWAFDAMEYAEIGQPMAANDFALFIAGGHGFRIMDVRNQVAETGIPLGLVEGIARYTVPTSGPLVIGFAAFDEGVNSGLGKLDAASPLFVDDIRVNHPDRHGVPDGYSLVGHLSNGPFETFVAA